MITLFVSIPMHDESRSAASRLPRLRPVPLRCWRRGRWARRVRPSLRRAVMVCAKSKPA